MKLVIFDIDGTIIDSVKCDDDCYVQSLENLFKIKLNNFDWSTLNNITDSGITNDLFLEFLGRLPHSSEIKDLKEHYYQLLVQRINEIKPIPGAKKFVEYIDQREDCTIVFATGGWQKNAILKSSVSGLDIRNYIYRTSDDHFNRAELLKLAISNSLSVHGLSSFEQIFSIGDGLWDLTTAQELQAEFIGVDFHENQKLKRAGALRILKDFNDLGKAVKLMGI